MKLSRPTLVASIVVAAVLIVAALGIFLVETLHDSAICSVLPAPVECGSASPVSVFTSAVYASAGGLLLAAILAVIAGVNLERGSGPNTSLARFLEIDERQLEGYRARRAQLDEWTVMAQARAAQEAARAEAAAQAAAEAEAAFEAEAARWIQEEQGEEEEKETEGARRSRVLAEHLAHLARTKPEAVAAVVSGWINQRPR